MKQVNKLRDFRYRSITVRYRSITPFFCKSLKRLEVAGYRSITEKSPYQQGFAHSPSLDALTNARHFSVGNKRRGILQNDAIVLHFDLCLGIPFMGGCK